MNNLMRNTLNGLSANKFLVLQVRFYSRWTHRRPVKVYSAEEYDEVDDKVKRKPKPEVLERKTPLKTEYVKGKINWGDPKEKLAKSEGPVKFRIKPQKPLVATYQKTKPSTDMLETVIDGEGNFVYTKMANNDQRVGTILAEIKSKKEKEKKDLIMLEGKRLIKDGLVSGCDLKYILFSRKDDLNDLRGFLPKFGVQLYKMPYNEMQMWSSLTTTPGIIGIFKTPDVEAFKPSPKSLPVTIICDNVREPGNLGAILRICAGLGCEKVILTKGCVHLWDSKVLRSAVGAHFKLQIHKNFEWDNFEEQFEQHNVNIYIADNKVVTSDEANEANLGEILQSMPVLPYYGINFKVPKHIVLIIGGETQGISQRSYEVAAKHDGVRLNIPLSNDVESLNVGAALGVIAFEVKRQLSQLPCT